MELSKTEQVTGGLEIFRCRHSEFTIGVMFWMSKSEPPRMQHHPGDLWAVHRAAPTFAVEAVAENRVSDRLKMRSNLMGPACTRHQHEMRSHSSKDLLNPVRGGGGFRTQGARRRPCRSACLRTDGLVDQAYRRVRDSMDERFIFPVHAVALELFRQAPMSRLGFGNHEDPRGVLIESMDNADVVYAAGRVRMVE